MVLKNNPMKNTTKSATSGEKLNRYGVPICPECGKDDFKFKTTWGLHRRTVHQVLGTSTAALAARRALRDNHETKLPSDAIVGPSEPLEVEAAPTPPPTPAHAGGVKAQHECPECRMEFKNAVELGKHLFFKHGIRGTSHLKKAARNEVSTEVVRHASNSNNGTGAQDRHAGDEPPITRDDVLVALAIGEIKGLIRHLAESQNVPTLEFTGRVVAALSASTRRR